MGPTGDTAELAEFGYQQRLSRSLGSFSAFAAGFSAASVLTGIFELFFLGFGFGGPASFWTWPLVFFGQLVVALCFAEVSARYPIAGSVYQWAKQLSRGFESCIAGWFLLVGNLLSIGAVAVAYQVILPQVSSKFEFIGGRSDIGSVSTPNGAKNALLLAAVLIIATTVINCIGIRLMAVINNIGVIAEGIGAVLLVILLAVHIQRGPGVVFHTNGTGAGHQWGYVGAFLVAMLMSGYIQYGFDSAGQLVEETRDPRRHAPRAIVRSITAVAVLGALILLVSMMAVGNIHASQLSVSGMPYLVKSTLGTGLGDFFLVDAAIAVTVCTLATHTAAIRLMFAMARDNRLPFGDRVAHVSRHSQTPIVPAVFVGLVAIGLLVLNVGNQEAFFELTGVSAVVIYLAYAMVTVPLLRERLSGRWPRSDHGDYFRLGRAGMAINVLAVLWGLSMAVNMAWPRAAIYGDAHWYYRWSAPLFCAIVLVLGAVYYRLVQRHKLEGILAEHRADGIDAVAQASEPTPETGLGAIQQPLVK